MDIRKMHLDDYTAVYKLWCSCKGMGLNNLDDSQDGIACFLRRNPDTCFVAEEHGQIVGVILAGSDGRRGYIYHTAVHPQYRRRGIAAQLVETVLQALRRAGVNKASLVVFADNEAGNRFWQKMGFLPRQDIIYRDRPLAEMERQKTQICLCCRWRQNGKEADGAGI